MRYFLDIKQLISEDTDSDKEVALKTKETHGLVIQLMKAYRFIQIRQTMPRLVGFGDNAGSGFPTILNVWKSEGWVEPQLIEDTSLNQVTLVMKMERKTDENVVQNVIEISENPSISIDKLRIALDVTDRTIARYYLS